MERRSIEGARKGVGIVFLLFLAATLATALLRFRLGPVFAWGLGVPFVAYVLLGLATLEPRVRPSPATPVRPSWRFRVLVGLLLLAGAGLPWFVPPLPGTLDVVLLLVTVPGLLAGAGLLRSGLRMRRPGSTTM